MPGKQYLSHFSSLTNICALLPLDGSHMWNRNCLSFQNTRVHPRFLVLFRLQFSAQCFAHHCLFIVCHCLFFLLDIVLSVHLRFTPSDYHFCIFNSFFLSLIQNICILDRKVIIIKILKFIKKISILRNSKIN